MDIPKVMYGLIDTESGDLVLVPDKDGYLRSLVQFREDIEFLSGRGTVLVQVRIEPTMLDTAQHP